MLLAARFWTVDRDLQRSASPADSAADFKHRQTSEDVGVHLRKACVRPAAAKPRGPVRGIREDTMEVRRFESNPIIRPEMLPGSDGDNINGPSLIYAPDWLDDPLGHYYLYFAHHGGQYIRLAIADDLAGPWRIYEPGTLRLEQTPCKRHVASPDLHVDDQRRELRMYYHGCQYAEDGKTVRQFTYVATSRDGVNFTSRLEVLGDFYFRVFQWQGAHYCCCKAGQFMRSPDGLVPFERGPKLLQASAKNIIPRHMAIQIRRSRLRVFYSRIGDCPERILLSEIDISGDWTKWQSSEPTTILLPELGYEGVAAPHLPSSSGKVTEPAYQLRDPAIYEEDGRSYLLYSVAGESAIAIAELTE